MKVSIRDISRELGLSLATVSNALNHKPGVSDKTTKLVLKTADEMGYKRHRKIDCITFILVRKSGRILDEGEFHPAVMDGAEREAHKYNLPINYTTINLSDPTAAPQIKTLCNDINNSGLILLGTEMDEEDYVPFYNCHAPLVIVDGWCTHAFIESIVTSNESSAYNAVHYLINKGHKKIGYIRGNPSIRNFPLRQRGYRRALEEAGLKPNPKYQVTVGTTFSSAYVSSKEWLDKPGNISNLPTAFFAENDIMACGMMRALLKKGIGVPGDVSLVGFDDMPVATAMLPGLTTIHVPKHDIGAIAVRKLIEQIRTPHAYTCVTHISTTFIERGSVQQL